MNSECNQNEQYVKEKGTCKCELRCSDNFGETQNIKMNRFPVLLSGFWSLRSVLPRQSGRNSVAHLGEFCNIEESKEVIEDARHFIETVVTLYDPGFKLKDKKKRKK